MPSDAVKKILSAEAEADRLNAGAKVRCEEIVRDAKQKAAVSIQKMLSQANAEADRLRSANAEKLKSYQESAQENCQKQIEELHRRAAENSEKAVDAIISGFFS